MHVNRQYHAVRPNAHWVSDFTYVVTWAGFVYVAFVIDAHARGIVGRRVSRTAHVSFVSDALEQALHVQHHIDGSRTLRFWHSAPTRIYCRHGCRLGLGKGATPIDGYGGRGRNALGSRSPVMRWPTPFNLTSFLMSMWINSPGALTTALAVGCGTGAWNRLSGAVVRQPKRGKRNILQRRRPGDAWRP